MCYYNQKRWRCGYWRWDRFSKQCPKERRTGETCGLKLVMHTFDNRDVCALCLSIARKKRRLDKMKDDIARWRSEGNKPATVERTEAEKAEVEMQMHEMKAKHYDRVQGVC